MISFFALSKTRSFLSPKSSRSIYGLVSQYSLSERYLNISQKAKRTESYLNTPRPRDFLACNHMLHGHKIG